MIHLHKVCSVRTTSESVCCVCGVGDGVCPMIEIANKERVLEQPGSVFSLRSSCYGSDTEIFRRSSDTRELHIHS